MNELYVMGMITNRGIRSKMIPFFKEHHIHVTLSTMGVGTANSAILDYLGMEATEKTIYFAFVTMETWKSFGSGGRALADGEKAATEKAAY